VTVWKNSQDAPTELLRIALAAMVVPVSLFEVRASNGQGDKDPRSLGFLVRVDNGFRYLDPDIFRSLSNAPPGRIIVSGNIQEQHLISKVAPQLSEGARKKHLTGKVGLHVIIATDGSVRNVDVTSGDPVLAQAAGDAVKQWRYQPTLLNGIPVEVDSAVYITFGKQ
jgi:TonB family protein